jgi:glycosyltransferase involved in cell wall biosynthesis
VKRGGGTEVTRVALLLARLAGYSLSWLRELKARHGVELLVVHHQPEKDAPFRFGDLGWIDRRVVLDGEKADDIARIVRSFAPQGLYVTGWWEPAYVAAARELRRDGVAVVAGVDGQWRGTVRQHAGSLSAARYLHPWADALWVPGDRQAHFARRLGYAGTRCWHGLYACDWDRFAVPDPAAVHREEAFLYVGRYVPEKAFGDLLDAYAAYRAASADPWPLYCAGAGPLRDMLEGRPGVVDLGFVQPDALPALLRDKASAFVLPSRYEPWGVALQEAAASGLPLVASDGCGAAVHLLQDGLNGCLFEAGNPADLAQCLLRVASLAPERRAEWGRASFELSRQFTPRRWADTLVEGFGRMLRQRAGAVPAAQPERALQAR